MTEDSKSALRKTIPQRAAELKPLRNKAYKLWDTNPDLSPGQVAKSFGGKVGRGTVKTWKTRWLKRHQREQQGTVTATEAPSITWEQVLEAIPDIGVLGMVVIDGFMQRFQEYNEELEQLKQEVKEKNKQIRDLEHRLNDIIEDRKKVMQEYNELMSKVKCNGHYTIDGIRHMLIPKSKEGSND